MKIGTRKLNSKGNRKLQTIEREVIKKKKSCTVPQEKEAEVDEDAKKRWPGSDGESRATKNERRRMEQLPTRGTLPAPRRPTETAEAAARRAKVEKSTTTRYCSSGARRRANRRKPGRAAHINRMQETSTITGYFSHAAEAKFPLLPTRYQSNNND
jgi:hypothetical protein